MQIRDLPSTSTVESTDYLVKEQSDGTTQKIAVGDFVVNNLTSGGTTVPLSAEMGKQIRNTFNVVSSNVPITNKTVANGTFETMATFTPNEDGSYLIIANMGYGNDTNGIRILLVDTTETSSNTASNSVLVVGRSMLQRVSIYALTTNDTVYIRAYQNSGGDLTVGGSYRVLRLK